MLVDLQQDLERGSGAAADRQHCVLVEPVVTGSIPLSDSMRADAYAGERKHV